MRHDLPMAIFICSKITSLRLSFALLQFSVERKKISVFLSFVLFLSFSFLFCFISARSIRSFFISFYHFILALSISYRNTMCAVPGIIKRLIIFNIFWCRSIRMLWLAWAGEISWNKSHARYGSIENNNNNKQYIFIQRRSVKLCVVYYTLFYSFVLSIIIGLHSIEVYMIGDIFFQCLQHEFNTEIVFLTPKAFALLLFFTNVPFQQAKI